MRYLTDLFLIIIVSPFLLPAFLVIAILVKVTLGSPIFFWQIRPGLHGKPFQMVKFRTMLEFNSQEQNNMSDSDRLTPFGSWLRTTSLDELPEIYNVLRGEMSLVGPRPLLVEYLPLYNDSQKRRHDIKPGITGWAQINGRNNLTWEEKFQLDVWYVENQSYWLNIKILLRTIKKVFLKNDISAKDQATMPRFTGNQEK